MHRLALMRVTFLLVAAAPIPLGNANPTDASAPTSANTELLAGTSQVASTAARARICGLSIDAANLRASYLAYEAKQDLDGAQLALVEKNYDDTQKSVAAQGAAIAGRCSAQQVASTRDRSAEFSQKYKEQDAMWREPSRPMRRDLDWPRCSSPRPFGRTRMTADSLQRVTFLHRRSEA